jgi:hypothetical protein
MNESLRLGYMGMWLKKIIKWIVSELLLFKLSLAIKFSHENVFGVAIWIINDSLSLFAIVWLLIVGRGVIVALMI